MKVITYKTCKIDVPSPITIFHQDVKFTPAYISGGGIIEPDDFPSHRIGYYDREHENYSGKILLSRLPDGLIEIETLFRHKNDAKGTRYIKSIVCQSELKDYILNHAKTIDAWVREAIDF